jgi:hypothetical protein
VGRPSYVAIPPKYERVESSGLDVVVKRGSNRWDVTLQ